MKGKLDKRDVTHTEDGGNLTCFSALLTTNKKLNESNHLCFINKNYHNLCLSDAPSSNEINKHKILHF